MNLLTLIVIALFLSLFFSITFKKINISPIVSYIMTGAIISFSLNLVNIDQHILSEIAEFGIVFLMFTIGLEFSIHHLKSMKKEVFVFGSLQVVLTSAFFSYLAYTFFSFELKTSIAIGTALSLSSTAIVLKTLNENGDIHRPYGRYSLGVLLFQDLAVIPMLLMISIFANPNESVGSLLLNTLYSGILVLLILFVFGKYVLTKFFAYVVEAKSEELFISAVLLIVLSSSMLAHQFGFSYSLGAFIAGMLIAETKYKHQIEADLVPFRDILLGVFFISVGLQLQIDFVLHNLFTIVAITASILLLKAFIIFIMIYFFSFAKRALKSALALAQVGEFSFAVLALAYTNNLIDTQTNQILISVVVISLIFTSLVIKYVRPFSNLFFREKTEVMDEPIITAETTNHVVVCGYSLLGQKVVRQLKRKGISYIAIDHDQNHVKKGIEEHDSVIFGNAASKILLQSVYIKNAIAVIVTIDNDEKVRLICDSIRAIDNDIPIILKISHQAQLEDLEGLGIKDYVNENSTVAKLLVSRAIKCDIKNPNSHS